MANNSLAALPTLSADQQKLLLAALSSNERRQLDMAAFRNSDPDASNQIFTNVLRRTPSLNQGIDPHVFDYPQSSMEKSPTAGWAPPTFGNSFLPDFSNGHETDFDVDLPQDILDGLPNAGNGEKRKSPEDGEDDSEEEQDPKRRDGEEKVPKKPGRKPLTVEPTTKRKAQNRAAQRAFRERKEQHLKDLETKISDLQKVSQAANQENSLLRAQVMNLQTELHNYKKRLSLGTGIGGTLSASPQSSNFGAYSGVTFGNNPFDFNFDAPSALGASPTYGNRDNSLNSNFSNYTDDSFGTYVKPEPTSGANSANGSPRAHTTGTNRHNSNSSASVFNGGNNPSPGVFNMSTTGYGYPQFGSPVTQQAQENVVTANGNGTSPGQARSMSGSIFSHAPSPSSSVSQAGPSSSCGTSPEPSADAPAQDKTAGNTNSSKSPFGDLSDFQFDPDLFGEYRETQDAIYGDGDFSGGLYEDFLNMPESVFDFNNDKPATPAPAKQTLMDEVARARDAGPEDNLHPPPANTDAREMMTCNKVWQQLKTCPKFQQGELDIDSLCSELSKKATCSESGATIPKDEWEAALWRLVGQPDGAKKAAATSKD